MLSAGIVVCPEISVTNLKQSLSEGLKVNQKVGIPTFGVNKIRGSLNFNMGDMGIPIIISREVTLTSVFTITERGKDRDKIEFGGFLSFTSI
jgi:hypothetical protein